MIPIANKVTQQAVIKEAQKAKPITAPMPEDCCNFEQST
jgi:hypothetical protein